MSDAPRTGRPLSYFVSQQHPFMRNRTTLLLLIACMGILAPVAFAKMQGHDIHAAIRNADTIYIEEHTNFFDEERNEKDYREKILKKVKVTRYGSTLLAKALEPYEDHNITSYNGCVFTPHHRIIIIAKDGKRSVIEICFMCGDIDYNGKGQPVHEPWIRNLTKFIKACGLDPDIGKKLAG